MQDAVAFFAMRLIVGIAYFCYLLADDERRVVSGFFRVQMLLMLGLAVVFGLAAGSHERLWGVAMGLPAFVGSILWLLERRRAGRLTFVVIHLAALFCLSSAVSLRTAEDLSERALLGASALASAGTLGAMMCGMLLGHRYLTAPGMPLAPLHWINNAVGAAGVLRMAASIATLVMAAGTLSQTTYVVWLALRWLAGIGGPLVVWYMVRRILIHKNTQSATGVLFVGVILTFIGELTADLLFRVVGVPF
jgi:hypothetical protein